jgi:AraC-like DNA-binding protein
MKTTRTQKIVAATVAGLAVAGGSAAIAATQSTPKQESQAVVNDAAQQLGVSPQKLSDALKQALKNRVDAAVADGRLTKEQADSLKARIDSDEVPLFGLHGGGHYHGHYYELDTAASYLGLSEDALRTQLESGKSLAQVAQDRGKSVDGLVDALVADEKQELADAVTAGRLTQAEADAKLANLRARIADKVNGVRPQFRGGGRFGGPPPDGPAF